MSSLVLPLPPFAVYFAIFKFTIINNNILKRILVTHLRGREYLLEKVVDVKRYPTFISARNIMSFVA
jgi:hypothetical protein